MVVLLQVSALPAPDQSPLSTPNILAPSSTPANDIYELSVFVLVLTGAIFAVVGGLILFAVIRFRASRTNSPDEPAQIYGSTQIELAWTVAPVLIVIVLFLTTARFIFKIQDEPKPPSALDVIVTGPPLAIAGLFEGELDLATAVKRGVVIKGDRRALVRVQPSVR